MLKNVSIFYHKIMTLSDQVNYVIAYLNKVNVQRNKF